jgi:hypothetical protein
MTLQPSLLNGARWRLIEINGVLFVVLICRVQQKRQCDHLKVFSEISDPPDKISGLSFDAAMNPREYKNLH